MRLLSSADTVRIARNEISALFIDLGIPETQLFHGDGVLVDNVEANIAHLDDVPLETLTGRS
jgi:hypothetical protein